LPGSGWLESSSKVAYLPVPGAAGHIPVNQLTYEKAGTRILVLYWYQNNRNIWAEEFQAKLRLLPDLIKYKRSDVSLVRLIAPLRSNAADTELTNCVQFMSLMFPSLVKQFGDPE
jgi:EpsI family protein